MRMKGGGASKGMRGEGKEEREDPKASADPAGNQGREGKSKQRDGKEAGKGRKNPQQPHLRRSFLRRSLPTNGGLAKEPLPATVI